MTMTGFGRDYLAAKTGLLYRGTAVWGVVVTILAAVGLVLAALIFQTIAGAVTSWLLYGTEPHDAMDLGKAFLIGMFPAGVAVAALAWWLAGRSPAERNERLGLHLPALGPLGWLVVIVGFLAAMYAFIIAVTVVLGINPADYTPGPNGESPESGSAGLVKELMFAIASDPRLFMLVFPAVVIGAPVSEEIIFRGQMFAALANSRVGRVGASVITSALWALMHMSEPWLSIGLIFVMGLVLSWLLLRYGSLTLTIILHGVWNGVYSLLIFGGLANMP
jgi:membrane protease YdiL (CAAX protease family)